MCAALPDVEYGLTAYYTHADNPERSLRVSSLDLTDTAVFTFAGPRWRIRPYAELHLVNILRHAGQVGGHFFFGRRATVVRWAARIDAAVLTEAFRRALLRLLISWIPPPDNPLSSRVRRPHPGAWHPT